MGREDLAGTWQCYKDENLDEFLSAMGVGMIKRKLAANNKPKLTIAINGDNISIKGNRDESVVVGQPTEIEFPALDTKMKVIANWDGDKIAVQAEPVANKGKPFNTVREIVNGELITTMTIGSIVVKRYFKRC